jgi:hypothetical protein
MFNRATQKTTEMYMCRKLERNVGLHPPAIIMTAGGSVWGRIVLGSILSPAGEIQIAIRCRVGKLGNKW